MDLTRFLIAWRTIPVRDREVIDALVDPVHAAPSPELARALTHWPGSWYWSDEDGSRHLVLTRPRPGARREVWGLHVALFLATLFTTTWAGATFAGTLPYAPPFGVPAGGFALGEFLRGLVGGLGFSLPLMAILLAHELGHYLTARTYHLDASPPYFIPVPFVPSFIGTMGAFIRLRTIVSDRRQMFDVAVAGPIAGFVVALPVLWLGLAQSSPAPGLDGMVLWIGGAPLRLGDSVLTLALRATTAGAAAVAVSPVAFAGWIGMFVTMLNLLPIAQLDGGHILYAALPRWQERVAMAFLLIILGLGWYSGWPGWWVFGAVVLVLSRGRLSHPPVLDVYRPLPPSRRWLAWGALVLFVITFAPVPFRI